MIRIFAILLCCFVLILPVLSAQSFREVSEDAGIATSAIDPLLMAGGIAWFDYNNDRFPDLLSINGQQATRLYRNNWDGTFTDVSESAGLLNLTGTMGAVSGDFNDDGFADLFITTMEGTPNLLLRNTGDGTFQNVATQTIVTKIAYSASATTGDYDGDGDLDIYVSNYLAGTGPEAGGQPNFLYRNEGGFNFTEVAASLQLDDHGCGLGATFSDLNDDGRPDLYVANDYGYVVEPNAYFQNNFPFFSQTASGNGSAATINAMGIAKGDYDNDGDQDLYVTNIRENPLFENTDEGAFFSFRSYAAGVALPELTSWGTAFADFDLDGYLDLIVANGQVSEPANEAEAQRYFHNNGDGTFTDASAASGIGKIVAMGRGLAVADYDLDGRPDVVINAVQPGFAGAGKASFLHNESGNEGLWLSVEAPVTALKFTLYAGAQTWYREADGGSSYLSHSAGPIHFGAPVSTAWIDSLVVSFTDQPAYTFTGLNWNRLMGIRADGSWYLIGHESNIQCSKTPAGPLVDSRWQTDDSGNELLLLGRTETLAYPQLEEQVKELSVGEVYRGLARTQDAVLVDTIAGEGPCPALQPIRLKVLQAIEQPLVYPNPMTSNQLSLQLPRGGGTLKIELLTASGALTFASIESIASNQQTLSLTLPSIPRGVYILRLNFAGRITHHKLVRP